MTMSSDAYPALSRVPLWRTIGSTARDWIDTAYASTKAAVSDVRSRMLWLGALSAVIIVLSVVLPGNLGSEGRWTLAVLMIAVMYWSLSDVADVVVGLLATATLVVVGAVGETAVVDTLGHEFIWLLIVSFALGAIIRANGLVEWCFERSGIGSLSLPSAFAALTLFISSTAFLIPSTSARAAILLPIFLSLTHNATSALRTALGLLFPTVILLSAAGSLIGAGAHAVAAQFLTHHTGKAIDFIAWAKLALPFAAITTAAAAMTIYVIFVPHRERRTQLALKRTDTALTLTQKRTLRIISLVILAWMTTSWHGLGMVLVGLVGLSILLLPGVGGVQSKAAFKAVEIELLVFLVTTFVLADALMRTGAGDALASSMLSSLPQAVLRHPYAITALVAAIGLLAHLLITSRTARVGVLLPALVLPLIAAGHDPTVLVMITVLATGFCQTLPASAKPVGVFASLEQAPFDKADLVRLSAVLLPQMFLALLAYAWLAG